MFGCVTQHAADAAYKKLHQHRLCLTQEPVAFALFPYCHYITDNNDAMADALLSFSYSGGFRHGIPIHHQTTHSASLINRRN